MNQATGSVHFMMCIMHVYKIYCNQRKGALAHIPDMNFEEDESSSSSLANGCIECCFLGEARFLCASDSDAVGMVHRGFVGLQHHNKVDAHTNAKHRMNQNHYERSENLPFSRNLVKAERKRRAQGGAMWTKDNKKSDANHMA